MVIPGHLLGILPRMALLMALILSAPTIIAGVPKYWKGKRLIDFDISGPPPTMVRIAPSKAYPGGTNYTVSNGYLSRYIIGRVRDGQEVLMDGDSSAMSRHVLVHPREDGLTYIRVMTRKREVGKHVKVARRRTSRRYFAWVKEFVRRPDGHYAPIIRTPIEVDVLTQDITPYIHVDILGEWEGHEMDDMIGRTNGDIPTDMEILPMKFSIREEMALHATIGVVKFGEQIVEDRVDGLMSREVSWEGGLDRLIITILSRYTDDIEKETKHMFADGERRFILYKTKTKLPLPCD